MTEARPPVVKVSGFSAVTVMVLAGGGQHPQGRGNVSECWRWQHNVQMNATGRILLQTSPTHSRDPGRNLPTLTQGAECSCKHCWFGHPDSNQHLYQKAFKLIFFEECKIVYHTANFLGRLIPLVCFTWSFLKDCVALAPHKLSANDCPVLIKLSNLLNNWIGGLWFISFPCHPAPHVTGV